MLHAWFYLANQSRLFRSKDGFSWEALSPLPGASPLVSVFQLYGRNDFVLAFTGSDLFRSANGGQSWQTAATPPGALGPLPPNFAVLGKYWYASSGKLLVSSDEGASWGLAPGHPEAASDLWAVAANETALLCGSQTLGVYQTDDDGQHFHPANRGLTGSMVSDVAALGSTLYAWDAQGISNAVFPDLQWDTAHLYPTASLGTTFGDLFVYPMVLFAKQAGGALQRSADAGKTWQPVSLPGWAEQSQAFKFEAKGDTLFLAAPPNALWQTVDAGLHWTDVAGLVFAQSGLRTEAFALKNGAAFLLSGSTIHRSTDQMKTWTAMGNSPGQGARLFATASRLFALVPGGTPLLFVSPDEGQSWALSNIAWPPTFNGQPDQRVSIFQWGNVVLGAFEQGGIFTAGADGLHWQVFADGLPVPQKIKDLATNGQILLAGTAEGLFWRPFSDLGVVSAGEKPDMVRLRVAPNPGDGIFSVFLE